MIFNLLVLSIKNDQLMNNLVKKWNITLEKIQTLKNENSVASSVKIKKLIREDQQRIYNFEKQFPRMKEIARNLTKLHAEDVRAINYSVKLKNVGSIHALLRAYIPGFELKCKARPVLRFMGLFLKNKSRIQQDLYDIIAHSLCYGDPIYIERFLQKMKCECNEQQDCYIGRNKKCNSGKNNNSQLIHLYYHVFVMNILNFGLRAQIFNNKRKINRNQSKIYTKMYTPEDIQLAFDDGVRNLLKIKDARKQLKFFDAILSIFSKFAQSKNSSFWQFFNQVKMDIITIQNLHVDALKGLMQIGLASAGYKYRSVYMIIVKSYMQISMHFQR